MKEKFSKFKNNLTESVKNLAKGAKHAGGKIDDALKTLNPKITALIGAGSFAAFVLAKVNTVKGTCDLNCTEIAQEVTEATSGTIPMDLALIILFAGLGVLALAAYIFFKTAEDTHYNNGIGFPY